VHVDVYARTGRLERNDQCEQKVLRDLKGTPGRDTAPGDAYECTSSEGRRQWVGKSTGWDGSEFWGAKSMFYFFFDVSRFFCKHSPRK